MVPSAKQCTDALLTVSERYGKEKAASALSEFLTRTHLSYLLPTILLMLKKKEGEEKVKDTITVLSATPISESVIDRISDLAHKEMGSMPKSAHVLVDTGLVGGFVAVYKGRVFDGSVKTMLTSLLNKK